MRELVSFTAISGLSLIFNMLLNITRAKILAVLLGPSGVGLLAQVNNFDTLIATLASFGIGYGITNLISRSRPDCDDDGDIVRTGGYLLLAVYVPVALSTVASSRYLARYLLGDSAFVYLFVILAGGFFFQFYAFFFESIMQGYKAIKDISLARVISSALGLAGIVPLAWLWGINGAAIGMIAWLLFRFLAFGLLSIRAGVNWSSLWSKGRFRIQQARRIFRFGLSVFLINSLNALTLLFIRTRIVHYLGSSTNGIYQVVWAVSSQYLTLVPLALWSYAYPRLAEVISDEQLVGDELSKVLRLGILLITPMMFGILGVRDFLVRLLYTAEFLPAASLMTVQLWGDFARFLVWWVELPLYAGGKLSRIVMIEACYSLGYLTFGTILLHTLGLLGVCLGYMAANGLALLVSLTLLKKDKEQPMLIVKEYTLLIKSVIFLIAAMLIPQSRSVIGGVLTMTLAVLWGKGALSGKERSDVVALFKEYWYASSQRS